MEAHFSLDMVRTEAPRMVEHRRALHRIPELGKKLPATAAYVEAELRRLGLVPKRVGDGMWTDVGHRGPLVALRADMDALPVEEKTGASYASTIAGLMHACGHDGHTAALLGAAALLSRAPGELPFRVRLIFQTGEEGAFGARDLIAGGVLEGVASIAGGHIGDLSDELGPGEAGFIAGPMMAASDSFGGYFLGSGGHGSAPHRSPDPITTFAEFVLAMQYFRARELDQTRPAVVSICQVESGSTYNVIPERLDFKGTARSLDPLTRAVIEKKLKETGDTIAALRGLRFGFDWLGGYPPLVNDTIAAASAEEAAAGILGPGRVKHLTRPIMGGEDFAFYLERVPGCFWFMNTQAPARGFVFPNHNPRFDLDEERLPEFCAVNFAIIEALARIFP